MLGLIDNVTRWVAGQRPRRYALCYFAVLLVFACAYRGFSSDFYHSTASIDASRSEEERRLREILKSDMGRALNVRLPTGVRVGADTLTVDSVKVEQIYEQPRFALTTVDDADTLRYWTRVDMHFVTDKSLPDMGFVGTLRTAIVAGDKNNLTYTFERWDVELPPEVFDPHINPLYAKAVGFRDLADRLRTDVLNRAGEDGVGDEARRSQDNYVRMMKGFAGGSISGWSRAFYLSAVTITTLGFGDIVPVTDRGRLLIGFEALLGVFLIGLTFNSLANKAAGRSTGNPPSGPDPLPPSPPEREGTES